MRSKPSVERLLAYETKRTKVFVSSAARTAFEVAPDTPATAALIDVATTATDIAVRAAERAGLVIEDSDRLWNDTAWVDPNDFLTQGNIRQAGVSEHGL